MKTVGKFFGLVFLLNLARYIIGGPIEGLLIVEDMHAVMPKFPEVFNNEFGTTDFMISLGYNFMLWLTATWMFYLVHPALKGSYIVKSLKVFGLLGLFFVSLAAIYMNHYTKPFTPFIYTACWMQSFYSRS